jgi:hypothetical protein
MRLDRCLPLLKIALVLVRFDHIAVIVNADHGDMCAAAIHAMKR